MLILECIDKLLVGTKYLSWGIGVVGILGSIVLFFANLSLGFASAAVFIAAFFLFIAVALLLLPKQIISDGAVRKITNIAGGIALAIAIAVMGITYAACGGFPKLNLLFI